VAPATSRSAIPIYVVGLFLFTTILTARAKYWLVVIRFGHEQLSGSRRDFGPTAVIFVRDRRESIARFVGAWCDRDCAN
jgi:hypothetical protein